MTLLTKETNDMFGIKWEKFSKGFVAIMAVFYFTMVYFNMVENEDDEYIYINFMYSFPIHMCYYAFQFAEIKRFKENYLLKKESFAKECGTNFAKRIGACQINFLILHGKESAEGVSQVTALQNKQKASMDDLKTINGFEMFLNDKEYQNDIDELRRVFIAGDCDDGGIL